MRSHPRAQSAFAHVLEPARQALLALDNSPREHARREQLLDFAPEFVTPAEARRDLTDPSPRIRRYAQTVLGMHAEQDRRGDMEARHKPGGNRL